jgi:hypothetical protein
MECWTFIPFRQNRQPDDLEITCERFPFGSIDLFSSRNNRTQALLFEFSIHSGRIVINAKGLTMTEIIIRDFTGKKLQQLQPGKGKVTLDLSGYAEGVYLIEVSDGSGKYSSRVSIIH